jgi:CubicO group peptidase (beta-lactamase class C family)
MAGALISVSATAAASSGRPLPAELFEGHSAAAVAARLNGAFERLTRENLFSGAVLIAKGDKVLFEHAYGPASREYGVPNTIDTKFNLASAGKMFTSVAIGKLVDEGKIAFSDPVSKYLDSSWIEPSVARELTVADLLDHTSGLPDYLGPAFLDKSRTLFVGLDDYKPLTAHLQPTFPPGSRFSYSSTNFILLGAIIEKVAGEGYWKFVRQAVFEPAGMTRSGPLNLEEVNHGYAQGYAKLPPPPPPPRGLARNPGFRTTALAMAAGERAVTEHGFQWRNNVFMHVVRGEPSGGSFSTAPDLLLFANALASGRLIKLSTLRLMTARKPNVSGYAYGFQLMDGGFGHTGGFPGISTVIIVYPDGYRLIVLSNVDAGSAVANAKMLELAGDGAAH